MISILVGTHNLAAVGILVVAVACLGDIPAAFLADRNLAVVGSLAGHRLVDRILADHMLVVDNLADHILVVDNLVEHTAVGILAERSLDILVERILVERIHRSLGVIGIVDIRSNFVQLVGY